MPRFPLWQALYRRANLHRPYHHAGNADVTAPSTNGQLRTAANAWCANEADAIGTYGDIGTWVTSAIDDMSNVFNNKGSCNPSGIGSWDVSNVKSFK